MAASDRIAAPLNKKHRFRAAAFFAAIGAGVLALVDYRAAYWASAKDIHYVDRLFALFVAAAMCALALFLVAQISVEMRRVKAAYVRFPVAAVSAVSATFLIPGAQLAPAAIAMLLCGEAIQSCRFVLGPIFVALFRTASQSNFTSTPLWLGSIMIACVLLARRRESAGVLASEAT